MKRRVVVERVTTYSYELGGTKRECEDQAIELAENESMSCVDGIILVEKHTGEGEVISNEEIKD